MSTETCAPLQSNISKHLATWWLWNEWNNCVKIRNVFDVSGMIYCMQVEDYNITQSDRVLIVSLRASTQIYRTNQNAPFCILEDLIEKHSVFVSNG